MTCPRCNGLVVDDYGEVHCLLCGYYKNEPEVDPITRHAGLLKWWAEHGGRPGRVAK